MIKKEKENQNQKQTDSTEHIHKNQKWIKKARINAQKKLTPEMFKVYCDYSDELLLNSHSLAGRKKLLVQFVSVVNNFKIKDLKTITAEEIKQIVIEIMVKHSDNGKETWYSQDLKKVLRQMVRFAKTGSHLLPEEGELPELKQIKCKKIEDKLSRSDMPTKEDCDKILKACGTNLMDRAMFHVQMDAATRVGELLSLCLKHIEFDEYGALIAVDGKTGARKIRIVESVPDLIKWINVHPFREDRSHPLFITTINNKYYGQGLSYVAFKRRLQNVVAKTDIDKRIHSHLFRHAEITKRATQLTEAQARIRYGWGKSSNMPSRYTHLNDKDVDDKMLQIMGVKKKEVEEETSIIECQYCHVKYSKDTLYCETCAKPLDVVEAERMKQQQKEENEIMISELIRKEKSRESNKKYYNKRGEELENKIESQKEEIQSLKDLISKIGKAE